MANYSTLKYQGILSIIDSDYIAARVGDITSEGGGLDSAAVFSLIDSSYIEARSIDIDDLIDIVDSGYIRSRTPIFDSNNVTNLIDSNYINTRVSVGEVQASIDSTSVELFYPYLVDSVGFTANAIVSPSKLYFQPATGMLAATTFNSLSDVAYKQDVGPINNVLDIIESINAVEFNWKQSKKKSYGVIAQELEKIMPELVAENKGVKTVQYTPLIALLIEAVKELKKQIDNK